MTIKAIVSELQRAGVKIVPEIESICQQSILTTSGEVAFFRSFFPRLSQSLNLLQLPNGVAIKFRAIEIHKKPIVKFGSVSRCELGDFFINVKYVSNGDVVGRRFVIYQMKYSQKESFKIDPTQLHLLANWPAFTFGRKETGDSTFSLANASNDMGTYGLISKLEDSDCALSADAVSALQVNHTLRPAPIFPYSMSLAIFYQLAWRYGEEVLPNTQHNTFLDTLYRYVGWAPDPPDEFDGYTTEETEGHSFWGVEIAVSAG